MRLKDKIAIVTGGSQGIGRAIALGFGKEGARVVVGDIDRKKAEEVVRELEATGSKGLAVEVDVSDEGAVRALGELSLNSFGAVDILVNNAGIYPVSPVIEMTVEGWDRVIRTNLGGSFLCSKAVVLHMRTRKRGRIICISSTLAYKGAKYGAHYAASKAGIIGFVKALARELAGDGITVNAICPGVADTAQPRGHRTEEELDTMGKRIPLGRIASPEDIVGAVIFLASDSASYITGQALVVDGGAFMV